MNKFIKITVTSALAVGLLLPGCTQREIQNTPYGLDNDRNGVTYDNNNNNMYDNDLGLDTDRDMLYDDRTDYGVNDTDTDLSRRITTQGTTTTPYAANPNAYNNNTTTGTNTARNTTPGTTTTARNTTRVPATNNGTTTGTARTNNK